VAAKLTAIAVVDLCYVLGGVDKQTRALQLAIAQATSAVEDVAKSMIPKDGGLMQAMMMMGGPRRRGPGPTPAPALPPTSTHTR
jgi:hypothetical protein